MSVSKRDFLKYLGGFAASYAVPTVAVAFEHKPTVLHLEFIGKLVSRKEHPHLLSPTTFTGFEKIHLSVDIGDRDGPEALEYALKQAFPGWREYWKRNGCNFDDNGHFTGYDIEHLSKNLFGK